MTVFEYMMASGFVFVGIMFALTIASACVRRFRLQEVLRTASMISLGIGLTLAGSGLLCSAFTDADGKGGMHSILGLYGTITGIKLLFDIYSMERSDLNQIHKTLSDSEKRQEEEAARRKRWEDQQRGQGGK